MARYECANICMSKRPFYEGGFSGGQEGKIERARVILIGFPTFFSHFSLLGNGFSRQLREM